MRENGPVSATNTMADRSIVDKNGKKKKKMVNINNDRREMKNDRLKDRILSTRTRTPNSSRKSGSSGSGATTTSSNNKLYNRFGWNIVENHGIEIDGESNISRRKNNVNFSRKMKASMNHNDGITDDNAQQTTPSQKSSKRRFKSRTLKIIQNEKIKMLQQQRQPTQTQKNINSKMETTKESRILKESSTKKEGEEEVNTLSPFRRHEMELVRMMTINQQKDTTSITTTTTNNNDFGHAAVRGRNKEDGEGSYYNNLNHRKLQANTNTNATIAVSSQGQVSCEEQKLLSESTSTEICDCGGISDIIGLTILSCTSNCGVYCNSDNTVCGTKSKKIDYSSDTGDMVGTTEIFEYKTSPNGQRTETLELGITSDNDFCSFTINLAYCDCFMKPCGSDGSGVKAPLVDCRLLMSDTDIYDLCDTNTLTIDSGPFEYFSSGEFMQCIDNSPANDVCSDTDPSITMTASDTGGGGGSNGTYIVASLRNALQYPGVESCASENSASTGLWYNVLGKGGGVRVSTCSDETKFDTQLSVYTGSCSTGPEQLQCVAGNDDSIECGVMSTVTFFAEQNVLYHVRVHGFEASAGNVAITFEETNLAIPFCEEYKLTLEGDDPISETTCECTPDQNGQDAYLICRDKCSYCSSNNTVPVCADKSYTYFMRTGPTIDIDSVKTNFEYTNGLQGSIVLDRHTCSNNGDDCAGCAVSVDGVACNSCTPISCSTGEGQGYEINCANVDSNAIYSTCEASSSSQSGLFQALFSSSSSAGGFDKCIRDPMLACTALSSSMEDTEMACTCTGGDATNSISSSLTCSKPDCILCDSKYIECATSELGVSIDESGQVTTTSKSYQFTEGRTGLVLLQHNEKEDSCEVRIDGALCTSCQYATCSMSVEESEGLQVDCNNIVSGAILNECDTVDPATGFLNVLVEDGGEFDECLDPNANVSAICNDEAAFQKQRASRKTECGCEADEATKGYVMTCIDPTCLYCNIEATSCAVKGEGTTYNRFGQLEFFFEKFIYKQGRDDTVVLGASGAECKAEINGQPCNGCQDIACDGSSGDKTFSGIGVDCENIELGASYEDCGEILVDDGVLEVASSFEFDVCVDQSATAESVCLEEKSLYDSFSGFICNCTGPGQLGEFVLSCIDTSCLYCSGGMDVCGHELLTISYNRYGDTFYRQDGFQYVSGGSTDEVFFGSTEGKSNQRAATVNGVECSNYEFVTCQDDLGFTYEDPSIQCDNAPNGKNFEACSTSMENFEGLFAFLSPFEFDECFELEDPAIKCNETASFFSFNPDIECECDDNDTTSTLSCNFPECKYCNDDGSVCQLDAFAETYGEFGVESVLETYQYIEGRHERITVTTFYPSMECMFAIDGNLCSSCAEISCPNGPFGAYSDLKVDCSNLSPDGEVITYDCGVGHPLFQVFFDQAFVMCSPYEPPAETSSPTIKTASGPIPAPVPTSTGSPTAPPDLAAQSPTRKSGSPGVVAMYYFSFFNLSLIAIWLGFGFS